MKGKKRKGSTLSMVIIATIIVVSMVAVMLSMIEANASQTTRVYQYLNAKYAATSGSQVALGAYYQHKKENGEIYRELAERATNKKSSTDKIEFTIPVNDRDAPKKLAAKAEGREVDEEQGMAHVEITGEFAKNSRNSNDYNITIKSKAKMDGTGKYYVHTVVFNWATEGIKSEKGGLEP